MTDTDTDTNMTFDDFGFGPEVLKAIKDVGYEKPTPIQAQAIPHILMMRDVLGCAQTGTGKTASFTLPMIEILHTGRARARMPRSLILAPTRELAAQVAENFETYGKYHPLEMALLVGGVSLNDQIAKLDRGVDVLIATPGRLLDLFERGNLLLADVKVLVIDEADRMLDMGFIPDIEKIVSLIPPIRQTLMFSATLPKEIRKLAERFLSNPREVSVAPPSSPAANVKQTRVEVAPRKKKEALKEILDREDVKNAFIFCNRKRDVDSLKRWLAEKGFDVCALHGDMAQHIRTETLKAFRDEKVPLLVCSDVAARGLDIDGVSHVFNYDVPNNAEDYIHRIGRTGRAGLTGCAYMLTTREDAKYLQAIERLLGDKIPEESVAGRGMGGTESKSADKKPAGEKKERAHSKPDSSKPDSSKKQATDKPAGKPAEQKEKSRKSSARDDQKKHSPQKASKGRDQDKGGRRRDRNDGDNVQGFGDEVPAFFGSPAKGKG